MFILLVMIFVEWLYYNEFGYEIVFNYVGSEVYDCNIECNMVYYVIMFWF